MTNNANSQSSTVYHWTEIRGNIFLYDLKVGMFLPEGEIIQINGWLKKDKKAINGTFKEPPQKLNVLFDRDYVKQWLSLKAKKAGITDVTLLKLLNQVYSDN